MEADNFIAKIKANGTENDITDIKAIFTEYSNICDKIKENQRGIFALNVMCIICRNLEKVPSWSNAIDNEQLLLFCIHCCSNTNSLTKLENVKMLACIYHIHKYISKQTKPVSPKLFLKFSQIPFIPDANNLLREYSKTYWNIIVDRLTYIEKLKSLHIKLDKILPLVVEDVLKVINIYNTIEFCNDRLNFLVKKMHLIYNKHNLNDVYIKIFKCITEENTKIDKLNEMEALELTKKFNNCIYIIMEASKNSLIETSVVVIPILRHCITIFGKHQEIVHVYMSVFHTFLTILTEKDVNFKCHILKNVLLNCETAEKLGYTKALYAMYPYLNQYLRLYLEHFVNNTTKWNECFNEQMIKYSLKMMLYLSERLSKCYQVSKCENCKVQSGLHDVLRTTLLIKYFISVPLQQNMNITPILTLHGAVVDLQCKVLGKLLALGCANYENCFRRLQTDIHNTAILLNQPDYYVLSLRLFEVYIRDGVQNFRTEIDLKSISRALYNKGIRELEAKNHLNALKDAYLSQVFAYPESMGNAKYMNLVMDVKAKALKQDSEDNEMKELQKLTVLDVCKMFLDDLKYGNIKPFLAPLKFSELLMNEFNTLMAVWPSVVPVAGIWKSLMELLQGQHPWTTVESEDTIMSVLFEVILETPDVVRCIQDENFVNTVTALLERLEKTDAKTTDLKIMQATLLFLKSEHNLSAASVKYRWKATELTSDPNKVNNIKVIKREYKALQTAIQAVDVWMDIYTNLNTCTTKYLTKALALAQVLVYQLDFHCRYMEALELAFVCCGIAKSLRDTVTYVRNASLIVGYAQNKCDEVTNIIATASRYCADLINDKQTMEVAFIFICDTAMYYYKIGSVHLSAKCLRRIQLKMLKTLEDYPELNLDLAIGSVMEAQHLICGNNCQRSLLSIVNDVQRHYLSISNTGSSWMRRRVATAVGRQRTVRSSLAAAGGGAALRVWRRALPAAAAALHVASACAQAALYTRTVDAYNKKDAENKISKLEYILVGLESEIHTRQERSSEPKKFLPKPNVETMREYVRRDSRFGFEFTVSVSAFTMPHFLYDPPDCQCYGCRTPSCLNVTLKMAALEASMYFRNKQSEIARNYFEGAHETLKLVNEKLKQSIVDYKNTYESFLVDIVADYYNDEIACSEIEMLIENAFFELSEGNEADEIIVKIHERTQCYKPNIYLMNEINNLLVASAKTKEAKKRTDTDLDVELETLKLSPIVFLEPPKTPENRPKSPPIIVKMLVNDEDMPDMKRKPIIIDWNENEAEKPEFKKPTACCETPAPKIKPNVILTETDGKSKNLSVETPKPGRSTEFFTPAESPSKFFTPITSVKTYSSKTLLKGIAKNLESEFGTPSTEKKAVGKARLKNVSPAKKIPVRSSRLRQRKDEAKK